VYVDRVKLICEMARQEIRVKELAEKAGISRMTVSAMRCGKSCAENSVKHVARALGVPVESLLEDRKEE